MSQGITPLFLPEFRHPSQHCPCMLHIKPVVVLLLSSCSVGIFSSVGRCGSLLHAAHHPTLASRNHAGLECPPPRTMSCPFQSTRSRKPWSAVRSPSVRAPFTHSRIGRPACLPSVSPVALSIRGMASPCRRLLPSSCCIGSCSGLRMPALCSFRAAFQKTLSPCHARCHVSCST